MNEFKNKFGITKKYAKQKLSLILKETDVGHEACGEDLDFVKKIFSNHDRWSIVEKKGLERVLVQWNHHEYARHKGFHFVLADGSVEDLGLHAAIEGETSQKKKVSSAARNEIVQQRHDFDSSQPDGTLCEICGEPLQRGNRHVDHKHPVTFQFLLNSWLIQEGLSFDEIFVDISSKGGNCYFIDKNLAQSWKEFHKRHSVLRLVHPHENKSNSQ